MQVLGILLDNAIAHAQSNDTIQMGAKAEANYIVFYVKDHGCGIAEKDKEKFLTVSTQETLQEQIKTTTD